MTKSTNDFFAGFVGAIREYVVSIAPNYRHERGPLFLFVVVSRDFFSKGKLLKLLYVLRPLLHGRFELLNIRAKRFNNRRCQNEPTQLLSKVNSIPKLYTHYIILMMINKL